MTAIDAYRCGACEELFEDPGGPLYECSRCSGREVEERRCPACNIFMAKVADESCPSCEDGDDITPVAAWEAEDGSLHLSEAEAAAWDAGAGERAEAKERHRASMDAYFERLHAENRAKSARLLPALRRLADVFAPEPSMLSPVAHTIEALESDPESCTTYLVPVSVAGLARILLPGDETEADIAVGKDYSIPWERHQEATARLKARLDPLVTDPELRRRVIDDSFMTLGSAAGIAVEDLLVAFGLLTRGGLPVTVSTKVVSSKAIAACPASRLDPAHFLSDGSCLCAGLDGMTHARWSRLRPEEQEQLRDLSDLTPQLIGLEGWRVEVTEGVDDNGEPRRRRFYVGRSTGWRPIHLEIARRDSSGGFAASASYDSVRKLYPRDGSR